MANINGFDATTVEPRTPFEAIPAGKYLAAIRESTMKPTRDTRGQYLELKFEILDGPYKGRFVWARLNLQNANVLTVQIARAELSAICRAVGILRPVDSVELHGLPLTIMVRLKMRRDTNEPTNEIKGYAKAEAARATGTPGAVPAAAAAGVVGAAGGNAAPAPSSPPWRR